MSLFLEIARRGSLLLWGLAIGGSLALLLGVLLQVDWHAAASMLRLAAWPFVLGALALLMVEGIVTALRIGVFTPSRPGFATCLKVNAHYVLLLMLLPARLGEMGAVLLFRRYFRQGAGAALMSVLSQRLFDLAILGSLFMLLGLSLASLLTFFQTAFLAAGLLVCLPLGLFYLDRPLAAAAIALRRKHGPRPSGFRHHVLRLLLQARIWHRHGLNRRTLLYGIALTATKWACNLSSLALLFFAIHLALTPLESAWVASAYNLLAVLPIQTVGGIGLGEAGLAGLLAINGLPLGLAVGASLLVRLVLIAAPFLFWALAMGALRITAGSGQQKQERAI